MEGIRFSRQEIEALAARLAALTLSTEEQQLLIAIFSAAREHVIEYPEPEKELTDLRERLVDTFIPGASIEFTIFARVGPSPITPATPHYRVGPSQRPIPPDPQSGEPTG